MKFINIIIEYYKFPARGGMLHEVDHRAQYPYLFLNNFDDTNYIVAV